MHIQLHDKTAIVTGSTAGIGFAIAQGLANAGATVVINGRTREAVDRAMAEIGKSIPQAKLRGAAFDLGTAAGCASLVEAEPATDILINNLGVYAVQDFFEIADAEWQRFFEVNVMSGVRLSRAYVPGMLKNNWGRVVFISSESGINIPSEMIHYGFSKTAQMSIARGLAKRLKGTGVTVNSVLPGPTMSEGVGSFLKRAAETSGKSIDEIARGFIASRRPSSIIQRVATCEEVANLVIYAASKEASATTGAALRVDGGVVDALV